MHAAQAALFKPSNLFSDFRALAFAFAAACTTLSGSDVQASERDHQKPVRDGGLFDVSSYDTAFPSSKVSIRIPNQTREAPDVIAEMEEDLYSLVGNTADLVIATRIEKRGARVFLAH